MYEHSYITKYMCACVRVMSSRLDDCGGLAELGAGEIVFEHVRVTVEIDRWQRVVGERHERRSHVHRKVCRQQRRREPDDDVGGRRRTRGRGQRVGRGRAGQVAQERDRMLVGEEADGRRGGRTLAATAAAAAAAAQQVGRVLAEQRVHVVGRRGRQAAAQRGQVGRRRRRRYGRRHNGCRRRTRLRDGRGRQEAAERGNILHGQTERSDLRQLLVVCVHGQMGNGTPKRLESLVDLSHATPLARVRSLPPVPAHTQREEPRVLILSFVCTSDKVRENSGACACMYVCMQAFFPLKSHTRNY